MAEKKKIANFSIFLDLREGCQKHEDKEKTSKDPSFEEKKFAERNLSSEWFQSLPERTSTPTANSFQWSPWSSEQSSINRRKSSSTSKKIRAIGMTAQQNISLQIPMRVLKKVVIGVGKPKTSKIQLTKCIKDP